jgi:hypothetical protein
METSNASSFWRMQRRSSAVHKTNPRAKETAGKPRQTTLLVIEYNFEREGEIVVPAGAKAIGQLRQADRSPMPVIPAKAGIQPLLD